MNPVRCTCIPLVHREYGLGDRDAEVADGLRKCLTDSSMFCCDHRTMLFANGFQARLKHRAPVSLVDRFFVAGHSVSIKMRGVSKLVLIC
jgi:hypothetical protein